jgi:putative MATE family efflux protein
MQLQASYRQIWQLSYPLMLSGIALNVINVVNTAFMGRVSETALGAAAVSGVFYISLVMIAAAIGIGVQIIIARKAGEKKYGDIGHAVDQSFYILGALGVLLFLFLQFGAPLLLKRMITSPLIYESSLDYLHYRSYGIFFSLFAVNFRAFYTGVARTTVITRGIVLMSLLNVALDYCLIFGNLGFPEMGIRGAGLASTLSEIAALLFYLWYTFRRMPLDEMNLFRFRRVDLHIITQIINLSLPMMFQYTLSLGAWFLFFVLIEKMGEHELAISNILRSLYMVLMTPIWGYSAATPTMVSNLIGQGRESEVPGAVKKIILVSTLSAVVMILGNVFFPYPVLSLFTNDLRLIHDSLDTLHILSVSMIFFAFAVIYLSAVSGTGDTRMALVIEIIAITVYLLYLFYTTVINRQALEVVWASEIIYWILIGLLAFLRLKGNRWRKSVLQV